MVETGEFRPFLGRIDEAWAGASIWSALVLAIGIPIGLIVFGMAWAKGSLDYWWLLWALVGLAIVSAGGYVVIAMLAAMIRTSLTLTGEGLVYETARRRPDGTRTTSRIESPWSGVRAIRERLNWLGWRANCLEVDTDHGTFAFRTTRSVHDRLKSTIGVLAPNLSPDDWGNVAIVGTAYGVTFRAFPHWTEWMAVAPVMVILLGELAWSVGRLYDSGLPQEMRHPTPRWVYGALMLVLGPVCLVLMTPFVVLWRNYLDVAHDGLRHEHCGFEWLPPRVISTRTRLQWADIRRISWLNETRRGLLIESNRGVLHFGQHLSVDKNREILDEMRRHAPTLQTPS